MEYVPMDLYIPVMVPVMSTETALWVVYVV